MRTLFSRSHSWLRLVKEVAQGGLAARQSAWRVGIGLTARGVEDVGSVTAVHCIASVGDRVRMGDPLLRIEWEGAYSSHNAGPS